MKIRSLIIIGMSVLALGGCSSANKTSTTSTSYDSSVLSSAVTIKDMSFSPSTLTIPMNTTVAWTNNDAITHTVTGTGNNVPNGFDSGNLAPGGSFSFTFTAPGLYSYQCTIHPNMIGQVMVQ